MMLCDLNNPRRTCPVCGYRAKRLPTYRQCRPVPVPVEQPWRPVAVGDLVERWLTRAGITKERVERWTRTEGKPGGCGCAARQKWLNDWGNRVQYRGRDFLRRAAEWYGVA
jgi:hypothetical protein